MPSHDSRGERRSRAARYWRRNLLYVELLLLVWFAVSFGCGIILVDELDRFRLGGFPLGFWFAQQGAIVVFVVIIFVYAFLMNRLDRSYQLEDRHKEPGRDGHGPRPRRREP